MAALRLTRASAVARQQGPDLGLESNALDREADAVRGGSECQCHLMLRPGPLGGEKQLRRNEADRPLTPAASNPTQTLTNALPGGSHGARDCGCRRTSVPSSDDLSVTRAMHGHVRCLRPAMHRKGNGITAILGADRLRVGCASATASARRGLRQARSHPRAPMAAARHTSKVTPGAAWLSTTIVSCDTA
jgi:hypothetical protein